MAKGTKWTKEDDTVLKDVTLTTREVAIKLDRSYSAVNTRRSRLGIVSVRNDKKTPQKVDKVRNTVGGRIKTLRVENGLTQNELALAIGVDFKYAYCVISDYERDVYVPSDERLETLAKVLNTTVNYILTGSDEAPVEQKEAVEKEPPKKPVTVTSKGVKTITVVNIPDPQPLKRALMNHEGYMDPTAMKAIAKVTEDKDNEVSMNIMPGEVYSFGDSLKYYILAVIGSNVICAPCSHFKGNNEYIVTIRNDSSSYCIFLCDLKTFKRNQFKQKLFAVSEVSKKVINSKLAKLLGTEKIVEKEKVVEKVVEVDKSTAPEEMDKASTIFADSINYYNGKNGTSFMVPYRKLYLQDAIDISKEMNISLQDLLKDHTEDRVLDEIIMYEEKIKVLKAKIGME